MKSVMNVESYEDIAVLTPIIIQPIAEGELKHGVKVEGSHHVQPKNLFGFDLSPSERVTIEHNYAAPASTPIESIHNSGMSQNQDGFKLKITSNNQSVATCHESTSSAAHLIISIHHKENVLKPNRKVDQPNSFQKTSRNVFTEHGLHRTVDDPVGTKDFSSNESNTVEVLTGDQYDNSSRLIALSSSRRMQKETENTHQRMNPSQMSVTSYIDDESSQNAGELSNTEIHTMKKQFECLICSKTFATQIGLNSHTRGKHRSKPFLCSVCGKGFLHNKQLRKHSRSHIEKETYECSEFDCEAKFSKKSTLERHIIRKHIKVNPWQCSVCSVVFSGTSALQRHMRRHTGERPYQCYVCGKSFSHPGPYYGHMTIHTGEKPFQCSVCGASFARKDYLTSHTKSHTGEKRYQCSICSRKFAQQAGLQVHIRLHSGEKPYQCSQCSAKFTQSSGLKTHMISHSGEKRFECGICGAKFGFKHDLQTHMRIHTGEKPFECSVCNKKFAYRVSLQNHSIIHTGEKRFECSVCNKKFGFKSHVKRHMVVHTREKSFECSICSEKFSWKCKLQKHLKTHAK